MFICLFLWFLHKAVPKWSYNYPGQVSLYPFHFIFLWMLLVVASWRFMLWVVSYQGKLVSFFVKIKRFIQTTGDLHLDFIYFGLYLLSCFYSVIGNSVNNHKPKPSFSKMVKFAGILTLVEECGLDSDTWVPSNLLPAGLGQLTSLNFTFLIYKIEVIILSS